jgi:membrane protein implicated in regulation of membrane protease activity
MANKLLSYFLSGVALVLLLAVFLLVSGFIAGALTAGTDAPGINGGGARQTLLLRMYLIGIVLFVTSIISLAVWWRWIHPEIMRTLERADLQRKDQEVLDEAMRDLSNAGWVLVNDSGARTSWTRNDLTLLAEFVNGELVLSGTGVAKAEADLDT